MHIVLKELNLKEAHTRANRGHPDKKTNCIHPTKIKWEEQLGPKEAI